MDITQSSNRIVNSFPPLNNITPFTRVDGWSFLEVLEGLRNYVVNTLVTEIDDRTKGINERFDTWFAGYVEDHAAIIEDIESTKTGWMDFFNEFMENVTAELAKLNDPAVEILIRDGGSLTRAALNEFFAGKVIQTTVESGRLSAENMANTFAGKSTQETVEGGRLSPTGVAKSIKDSQFSIQKIVAHSKLTVYGDSYTHVPGAYVEPYVEEWSSLINADLGIERVSYGKSGARMIAVARIAIGGNQLDTDNLNGAYRPGTRGPVAIMAGMNDILNESTVNSRKGFEHALRAFLATVTAGLRIEAENADVVGTWGTMTTDPGMSNGSGLYNNNPGDAVRFKNIVSPTGKVFILTATNPDTYAGGEIGFRVNGFDTLIRYQNKGQMEQIPGVAHGMAAIEVPVPKNVPSTIEVLHMFGSTGTVYVDALLVPAECSNPVIVALQPPVGELTTQGRQDMWDINAATHFAIMRQVTNEFPMARVIDCGPGWNAAIHASTIDTAKFHPNPLGMRFLADKISPEVVNGISRLISNGITDQVMPVPEPEKWVGVTLESGYASQSSPDPARLVSGTKVEHKGLVKKSDGTPFGNSNHTIMKIASNLRPTENIYLIARGNTATDTFNVIVEKGGDVKIATSSTTATWVSLAQLEWRVA